MEGSVGNDLSRVESPGDVVTELPGGLQQSRESSISYTLGANLKNLTLVRLDATGNELNNRLIGNNAANR
jgi:hypothetical protein